MVKTYFKNIKNALLEQISNAQQEISVAVAWFTNHELFNALCEKLKEGKKVSICIINDEINNREDGLNFEYFISLGGKLYFGKNDELMHHKFCIIDRKILFNGSYNWTYYAENRNRENIILFSNLPDVITEFEKEFKSTILSCDLVSDVLNYIKTNKPHYSQELSKYLSYDILYQAKQNVSTSNYSQAQTLIKKSLSHFQENKETILEQTKLDVIVKTNPVVSTNNNQVQKQLLDIPKILSEHQQTIFDNYISDNPNRQKAYQSALAIYDYEKVTNFKNISAYNPVNPGYIAMVFGEYDKAKEFFSRSISALGYYDYAILFLLQNDMNNFILFLNKSIQNLGNSDQQCAALYIPRKVGNMIEYVEKKQTNQNSTDTISLKQTILQIKKDFNI